MASENHNKKPLVIERRRGKERKKTPRLTKTYEVKIIPATIGVVMETEEPPKKRVAASTISWARKWASAWSLAAGILFRLSLWQRPT